MAIVIVKIRGDDRVRNPRLVFDTEEHKTLGRSRTLTRNDASRDFQLLSAAEARQIDGAENAALDHLPAMESPGMRAGGKPGAAEVGDEALFIRHARQRRRCVGLGDITEQRTDEASGFFDLPE